MTVVYSKNDLRDLDTIATYAGWHDLSAKSAFLDRVEDALHSLDSRPILGATVGPRGIRRMLVRSHPYAIFYRFSGEVVLILRVRHTAKRPLRTSRKN